MHDLVDSFARETAGWLDALARNLDDLEAGRPPDQPLDAMMRAAHTVSGTAAFFDLEAVVRVARGIEDVLASWQADAGRITPAGVHLLRAATAGLHDAVDALAARRPDPSGLAPFAGPLARLAAGEEPDGATLAACGRSPALARLSGARRPGARRPGARPAVTTLASTRTLFEHFDAYARETARTLGREVLVELDVEPLEIDPTLYDALRPLLIHLVRNACDHGLEPPERRLEAGKEARGRLRLGARRDGTQLRIEVADDGAGIDVAGLRAAVLRRGLPAPRRFEGPDRRALLEFVFLPRVTTREGAGPLSGRGAGLSAVRERVEALGGRVDVTSEPGLGTTVTLLLPLQATGSGSTTAARRTGAPESNQAPEVLFS